MSCFDLAKRTVDASLRALAALMVIVALGPYRTMAQEPLLSLHGQPITTLDDWQERREQIKGLVLQHIYGFMPEAPKWTASLTNETQFPERNVHCKEIAIDLFKDGALTRTIHLSLFIPLNASGPVPVFLSLNKCGNFTVTDLADVSVFSENILHPHCEKWMEKEGGQLEDLRGYKKNFWTIDTLLSRGYAFATFHESDIAADVDDLEQGIFPFYPELKKPDGWRVISAWAWGLQRAVDYLLTDENIDPDRIALFGHSRRGKAALLAAALDERVAMVVPHQSGTGGMALGKKHPMETIKRITTTFPHWFNDNYAEYGKHPKELPIDQHYLIALVAPRPLLETVGTTDVWSSFGFSLKAMRLASPVYDLYQKEGMIGNGKLSKKKQFGTKSMGNLLQIRRPYFHTMNGDYWSYILDFADRKLKPAEK